MITIHDLVNKIKWDENENPEDYTLGYEDRVAKKIISVRFSEIKRIEDNFMILERDMEEVSIPLHRVRVVKKKDAVVWERAKHEEEKG